MTVTDYDAEQLQRKVIDEYCLRRPATGRKIERSIVNTLATIRATTRRGLKQYKSGQITPDMSDEQIARSIGGLLLWWFAKELLLFIARYLAQQFWPDRPIGAVKK